MTDEELVNAAINMGRCLYEYHGASIRIRDTSDPTITVKTLAERSQAQADMDAIALRLINHYISIDT